MRAVIEAQNISKRFGEEYAARNLSLRVEDGEFLALLGPSGCGKTTFLRVLGGFERPDTGEVFIDGNNMTKQPPNKRPVNMLFQSYAVFPHFTVEENVAYGLRVVGTPKDETKKRVGEALALVRMGDFARRMPDKLSGGQRQRVALARALVKKPRALLLDEPLSALDAKLREAMQAELVNLQKASGISFVVVTHDQDEALSMATRIAVMNKGEWEQIAAPQELYERPRSRFVADFIGRMNILPCEALTSEGALWRARAAGLGEFFAAAPLTAEAGKAGAATKDGGGGGAKLHCGIRPEKLRFDKAAPPAEEGRQSVAVTTRAASYHGDETILRCQTAGGALLQCAVTNTARDFAADSAVAAGAAGWLSWRAQDMLLFED